MSPETSQIVHIILIGVIAAFLLWQSKRPITVANIVQSVKDAQPEAVEVAAVAEMAVMSAEQYGEDGILKTSEAKLKHAIKVFRRWVPASKGISETDMLDAIHAFVPVANALTAQTQVAFEIEEELVAGDGLPQVPLLPLNMPANRKPGL